MGRVETLPYGKASPGLLEAKFAYACAISVGSGLNPIPSSMQFRVSVVVHPGGFGLRHLQVGKKVWIPAYAALPVSSLHAGLDDESHQAGHLAVAKPPNVAVRVMGLLTVFVLQG